MGKKKQKRTPSPEYFGPQKRRKGADSEDGLDDEDGLNDDMNEDALREMMYEEAHHYRRRVRGDLADEEDARFMRQHVARPDVEECDRREKEEIRELNDELMD